MAVDYVESNWTPEVAYAEVAITQILQDARKAHTKRKKDSGDWGTAVHHAVEQFVRGEKIDDLTPDQMKAYEDIKNWIEKEKVKILGSEKNVYSRTHWYGGIFDLLVEWNGKKYIADIKTGGKAGRPYPEAWAQMAAYHIALEEMGEGDGVQGYLIIQATKDGGFDLALSENIKFNKDFFLAALQLFKLKKLSDESLKEV